MIFHTKKPFPWIYPFVTDQRAVLLFIIQMVPLKWDQRLIVYGVNCIWLINRRGLIPWTGFEARRLSNDRGF